MIESPEIDPQKFCQLILYKGAKAIQRRKGNLWTNAVGTTGHLHAKNK